MLLTGRELDRRGTSILPVADRRPRGCGRAAGLRRLGAGAGPLPRRARRGHGRDRRRHERRRLRARGARRDAADAARARALLGRRARRGARRRARARRPARDASTVLGGIAAALLVAAALNVGHERIERRPGPTSRPRLNRAAIPIGLVCGAAFVIEGGMENWGAVFLERDLDAAPAMSALAPAAYGGAMMLGRFSGQWLESRLGDTVLLAGSMVVALGGLAAAALAAEPAGRDRGVLRRRRGDLDRGARALRRRRPPHLAGGARQRPRDGDDARLSRLPRRAADRRRHRRGGRAESELRRARR